MSNKQIVGRSKVRRKSRAGEIELEKESKMCGKVSALEGRKAGDELKMK